MYKTKYIYIYIYIHIYIYLRVIGVMREKIRSDSNAYICFDNYLNLVQYLRGYFVVGYASVLILNVFVLYF